MFLVITNIADFRTQDHILINLFFVSFAIVWIVRGGWEGAKQLRIYYSNGFRKNGTDQRTLVGSCWFLLRYIHPGLALAYYLGMRQSSHYQETAFYNQIGRIYFIQESISIFR